MPEPTVSRLIDQLADPDGSVRERARHTLAIIGEPALPQMLSLLDSPSTQVRWEAVKTLTSVASASAIPGLLRSLADEESDIRWIAAEGLIRIGPVALPSVLRTLIAHPDSKYIRRGARRVLHGLSSENEIVAEMVGPAASLLTDTEPVSVILERAEEALHRICEMQTMSC